MNDWIKARESMTEGGDQCVYVLPIDRDDTGPTTVQIDNPDGRTAFEVALRADTDVLMRDEHGNVLQLTAREFQLFRRAMKGGEFDHIAVEQFPASDLTPEWVAPS